MSKALAPIKEDSFSRIVKFVASQEETGIVLTVKEEQILGRWMTALRYLKERKFTEEFIVEKIVAEHKVSKFTARNDISSARLLYIKQVKGIKEFGLILHVEEIDMQIAAWKNDKSLSHLLPKLYDSKTKALAALPEKMETPLIATPSINYNIVQNQTINVVMNGSDALAAADALIEQERNEDYTEFETVENGPKS